MPMVEITLTVDVWYEVENLDDPTYCFLQLDSTDTVICAFDASEPPATADVGIVLTEGVNALPIPVNKSAWIKLLSGAGSIIYSQFGGILFNPAKAKHAWTSISDTDVEQTAIVQVGFDDSGAEEYTYVSFLETVAAGIASAATIASARLLLQLSKQYSGKQFRVYGVAEPDSVFADIIDYASLASGLTLTTEFADVTIGFSGSESLDITDIVQELVAVSGWDATSPIQLWVGPVDSATAGVDATSSINSGIQRSVIFVTV
jgi:hypothetical protein